MAGDMYSAVWLSHSSIGDYLRCPRAYFLKNVYRDPKTRHKIAIMSPPLALGQAVHEVVERLSVLSTAVRFQESLLDRFEVVWKKFGGKQGGFSNPGTEERYKERGREMIRRVIQNPGPLKNLAVKLPDDLPSFWLSEQDNLRLCGKVDWLEYLPEIDSVHVIDFKTSKHDEDADSLQLPIYHLLVHYTQKRPVAKVSYWYLDHSDTLHEMPLPDLAESQTKILKIGKQMKLARQLEKFSCPTDGCRECLPFERILQGEAELLGEDEMRRDVYILPPAQDRQEAEIL